MTTLKNAPLTRLFYSTINVLWWVEWFSFATILIVGLVTGIGKGQFTFGVPVSYRSVNIQKIYAANDSFPMGILNSRDGNLFIQIPVTWQNAITLAIAVSLVFAAALTITYQLKMIFANFKKDTPFNLLNVKRILNIAYILMACSAVQWAFVIIVNQVFTHNLIWGRIKLTYDLDLSYLFTGFILIVVATIFRMGLQLEEDNKLTI